MLKRAIFERSRRELSLDVSIGVHILLVMEQSSLESQSGRCAKTPIFILMVYVSMLWDFTKRCKLFSCTTRNLRQSSKRFNESLPCFHST